MPLRLNAGNAAWLYAGVENSWIKILHYQDFLKLNEFKVKHSHLGLQVVFQQLVLELIDGTGKMVSYVLKQTQTKTEQQIWFL